MHFNYTILKFICKDDLYIFPSMYLQPNSRAYQMEHHMSQHSILNPMLSVYPFENESKRSIHKKTSKNPKRAPGQNPRLSHYSNNDLHSPMRFTPSVHGFRRKTFSRLWGRKQNEVTVTSSLRSLFLCVSRGSIIPS